MITSLLCSTLLLFSSSQLTGCQLFTGQNQNAVVLTDSLWESLAPRFKLSSTIQNSTIDAYKKEYKTDEVHMNGISKAAEPFLFYVVKKIERYNAQNGASKPNIPLEIALLPVVESLFDPAALNRYSGSAGLWQFMPATAKGYGLTINENYDGRLDIDKSTDAAIKYLVYLRGRFNQYNNNDAWLYALGSYNTGYARVNKAINANKNAGKPYDFFSLQLPSETAAYVPKLLAIAQLVQESTQGDIKGFIDIKNKPALTLVESTKTVSLDTISEKIDLPLSDLKALNPAFRQNTIISPYAMTILIPNGYEDKFNQHFNIAKVTPPKGRFLEKQKEKESAFSYNQLKSGQTVQSITQTYQETVEELKRISAPLNAATIFLKQENKHKS